MGTASIKSRIGLTSLAVCGVLAMYLVWPRVPMSALERKSLAEGRTVITYWDRHFGHEHEARITLIDEFNASQSEIYVRALPIGWNMEKIVTSIAGAAPPDIISLDGTLLAQIVGQGCFTPIEDFMQSSPVLQEEAFFPHIWRAVAYDGHVWAVPTTTDTVCLLWNKQAFRKAGLDPDRPPRTIQELGEYAARLTVKRAGHVEQMGFLPWSPWDQSHMWGELFGGVWYDPAKDIVCAASSQGIIDSFSWQGSFTLDPALPPGDPRQAPYALDAEQVSSFRSGFGSYMSANNPFYTGKVAMIADGEWQVTFVNKYAPGLDWGVAPLPQPEGVTPKCYSPTCIADAIPATARYKEEAKKFLRWFHTPRAQGLTSPASDYCFAIHNIPVRPAEAQQSRFMNNPKFRVFVEQLLTRENIPAPVMPVTQFLMDEMERQREQVVFHKTTPEQALRALEDRVNAELRRARAFTLAENSP